MAWSKTVEYSPASCYVDVDKWTDTHAGLSESISKKVTGMLSKVMFMMLEVNIAFHRLYMGDVVNKTCIIDHCQQVYIDLALFGNLSAPLTVQIQEVQLY